MKVGFDKEAPSPKLTFKLTGLLDDATYTKASALYENEIVREIVGMPLDGAITLAEVVNTDELEAAIAAKAAVNQAKAAPKVIAKAKPVEVTESDISEVVARAAPVKATSKAAAVPGMDELLGDLDALLGNTDD